MKLLRTGMLITAGLAVGRFLARKFAAREGAKAVSPASPPRPTPPPA
jgi:hypothetical protein